MATLTDNPSFTANEVYEIQQTDEFEGAATGASYGGIGLDNEPHQQLANRTAFLKGRQDTNIANISALQAFEALFTGLMGQNGYVQIAFRDVNRGLITAVVQWGYQPVGTISGDTAVAVNWPIPFPNACFWAGATLARLGSTNPDSASDPTMEVASLGKNQGVFEMDAPTSGLNGIARDFYWIAIGF